ncbi:MAG: protein translocase subunit SecF, partial [Elusimicrobiota bacterium]
MEIFRNTNFKFMAKKNICYAISLSLVVLSILSILLHGGFNYGIDFLGGYQILLEFKQDVKSLDPIRDNLNKLNIGNFEVKRVNVGSAQNREIQITIEKFQSEKYSVKWVVEELEKMVTDNSFELIGESVVGPRIGEELRKKAIKAIFLSLLAIVIYMWFRFEFWWGISGTVALFHDVVITLGVLSVLNWEIDLSVIAALLTVVGYSLNDNIVVFDRIRENLKTARREEFNNLADRSINETLGRTIITGVSTFVVCIVLAVFAGFVLRGFAIALCVGTFFGTYSSIFIATPLMIAMRTA